MKRHIKYLLTILSVFTLFTSCLVDPLFPDPGFDFVSDKNVEVRRDTADYYDIVMQMNVLNGVDKIEVLNGMNYQLIESVNSYKGQVKFEFRYRVDFSTLNVDTTLNFIIKVTDLDARSFNRGMTIKLKKFSIPEVITNGGDRIGVSSPVYLVRAKIMAGMNFIDTIKIAYEGELKKVIVPSGQLNDTIINELVIIGSLEWSKEYHLTITVKDNKGQETIKTLTLLRTNLQKPKSISYYDGGVFQGTWFLEYDLSYRLIKMTWDYTRIKQTYKYNISYNDIGKVKQIAWEYYYSYGLYTNYYWDRFYYNTNGRFEYMTTQNEKKYDTGAIVTNNETKLIENVVYNSNGTIKSVVSGATLIDNISYDPGFTTNDWVFAEYWYTPYSAIKAQYRQKRIEFQPVFMPTYFEEMPPFTSESGYIREMFNTLFFHKYIYGKNQRISDPSYDKCSTFSYVTDSEGRIVKVIRSYYNISQWATSEYRLNY